ncbi:MAG TPA: DUF1326 domain-containing protein [Vicinamibacterales bacterium]|nr:DUF1326 domain-containing protein [Vicinamibacterales bacterium]
MIALTEWTMKGTEVVNCNCNCGCPCQFSQPPTHGRCEALHFVQIETGVYGDVSLDGLRWGVLLRWPGAIHEGGGTMQAIVDERANARQRAAIESVAHGRDTEPGKLVWSVFASTISNVLPTLVKSIALDIDVAKGLASVHVPGVVDGAIEPIRNQVTGAPSRSRLVLPKGFEFTEAEIASGTSSVTGAIALEFTSTHAHLATIHWSTHGVVR